MKLIKAQGLYIFSFFLFFDAFIASYGFSKYRVYTLAVLIPILILYFYTNSKRGKNKTSFKLVITSLVLAYFSDLFYLYNNFSLEKPSEFIFGLSQTALLISYLVYGLIYNRMYAFKFKKAPEAFLISIVTVISSVLIYKVLNVVPLGIFKYGIVLGMILMIVVNALAANVLQDKVKKSMALEHFVPGTISLSLSLAITLVYKFLIPDVDFLPAIINLTFGFGQLLIVRGFVKYLKK